MRIANKGPMLAHIMCRLLPFQIMLSFNANNTHLHTIVYHHLLCFEISAIFLLKKGRRTWIYGRSLIEANDDFFLFSKCKFKFMKCRWDSTLKSISFDNQKLIINTVVLYYYFSVWNVYPRNIFQSHWKSNP